MKLESARAWPELSLVAHAVRRVVFPILLIVGLLGRYAALGLSAVNVTAVVACAYVLRSEGFEAALGQHYFWGLMLVAVIVFGSGGYRSMPHSRRTAAVG